MNATDVLTHCPVMPVVVIDDVNHALAIGESLLAGGVDVIEITLRTEAGLAAIEQLAKQLPELLVGAGTVTSVEELNRVIDAGARFALSPGSTPSLLTAAAEASIPFVPGVATPTEAMTAGEMGFKALKLFPATVVGGSAMLKAMYGPLPGYKFCPTGGVSLQNMSELLELPNVACVGGSWIVPKGAPDCNLITKNAAEAIKIAKM